MFVIRGKTRDGRRAEVTSRLPEEARRDRVFDQLEGDPIVADRGLSAAERGLSFGATPTGPSFQARLDEPEGIFLALAAEFDSGEYEVVGDTGVRAPTRPTPPGVVY